MIKLLEDECFEDLEYQGLKIIQHKKGYRFTSDAVLLANTVKVLPNSNIVDLGTGSGIIAILIAKKTKAKQIIGVEIQNRLYDMARRSVIYNNLGDRIKLINKPIQNIYREIGNNFDIVVCNPPYQKADCNKQPTEIEICRQEYLITLGEVIENGGKLLKFGGMFYLIIKSTRLAETIYLMKQNNVEPKKLTMVQPKANKAIDTVIIEAKKGARPYLIIPKPLVVYNDDGTLTDVAKELYGKGE